jgi:hypothetical protein
MIPDVRYPAIRTLFMAQNDREDPHSDRDALSAA